MTQEMYFIALSIQKIQHCRILKETRRNPNFERDFVLELTSPISAVIYHREKDISKIIFFSQGLKGQAPPIYGYMACFKDEFMDQIDFDIASYAGYNEDSAVLCVSEEQAKEQLRLLEEVKNRNFHRISLGSGPVSCHVVKDLIIDDRKGFWLAKLDSPVPGKYYKREKDISQVILCLKDFHRHGSPFFVWIFIFDEEVLRGDRATSEEIKLQYLEDAVLG
ncbi:hypothetical protein HY772_09285 [Candidatus Woesearchaeota archaeon]|nr:hypothetical protein [Candidatus Woesearchaeota archaeon]